MWIEIFLNSNTEFKLFIHNMPVDLGFETSSMEMRCIPRKTKKRGMLIQYKPFILLLVSEGQIVVDILTVNTSVTLVEY